MTIEKDPQECMENLNAFLKENLIGCCRELVEYDDTGILKDGKIREAISLLEFNTTHKQAIVIGIIKSMATRAIVSCFTETNETP